MSHNSVTTTIQGTQFGTSTDHVVFGRPAADVIVEQVEASGKQRVLITTSKSLAGPDDLPAQIGRRLGSRFAGVFSSIGAHAPRSSVLAGAAAAREAGADLLVSVGGGSVSDATKHMLLCLWENITDIDGFDPHLKNLSGMVDPSIRPADAADRIRMMAVPTLLSAGEFTWFAGITDERRSVKEVAFHTLFSPTTVVLDPAATLATPIPLLQSSGMKAVEHAVGFLCESDSIPLVEVVSAKAWSLLYDAIPKLGGPEDNPALRLNLLLGAWYSIYSVNYGLHAGASHAIGHVLGALGVPHGDTGSSVVPGVLRWNTDHNADRQELAAASVGQSGRPLPDILQEFARSMDRPTRLREVGIERHQFREIAEKSLHDPLIDYNSRPIASADDVMEILDLAW
ncbi:iron-containing alcohol dehydrogenase [Rhodococcus koreensis]